MRNKVNRLESYQKIRKQLKDGAHRTIGILLILATLVTQTPTFAFKESKMSNLAPLASMSLSKGRMIDINIANDGTTGYSTATLNSKLNEILKPKLAQEGINFKVNVIDSVDRNIYKEEQRTWTSIYDTGNIQLGAGWTGGLNVNLINDSYYGNWMFRLYYIGSYYYSSDMVAVLPSFDFNNYLYKYYCDYVWGGVQQSIVKQIENQTDIPNVAIDSTGDSTPFRVRIERTPKLSGDFYRGGYFNTGKDFYTANKIGPYGCDLSHMNGGVSGNINYRILPDNKILIKSFNFDRDQLANVKYCDIYYYSDYTQTNLIKYKQIVASKTDVSKPSSEPEIISGTDYILDYSDIKDTVKSFNITMSGFYNIIPEWGGIWQSYSLMRDGNVDSQWLSNIPIFTDNIKRKAYVSENLSNTTWRQDAEKFYVDLSNSIYSENRYGEGKSKSLAVLLNNQIASVKMGSYATKADSDKFVIDNDNNGRFIDNSNIDAAVLELTNYVLNRVKVNIDLVSPYDNSTDKATIDIIRSSLTDTLNSKQIDLKLTNTKLEKQNTGVYPINRFYFLVRGVNTTGLQELWYYDETLRVFVKTSTMIPWNYAWTNAMYITTKGEIYINYEDCVKKFIPVNRDVSLVASYALSDPAVSNIPWQYTGSHDNNGRYHLGISKLGEYTIGFNYYMLRTPDGNELRCGPSNYGVQYMYVKYPSYEEPPYFPASFSEAIQKVPNRSDTREFNYITYISTNSLNTTDINTVVNKLKSNSAYFVGITNSSNNSYVTNILSNNASKGTYIDNGDFWTSISSLASYVISSVKKPSTKIENGTYLTVSENETTLEFEAGSLSASTGVQVIEPLSTRTKEYISVNGNGNYTINKNSSTISSLNVYCYNSDLALVCAPLSLETNNRFTVPSNASYIKVVCQTTDTIKVNSLTITDNLATGGESIEYKPNITDIENDSSDTLFKFDHDNRNIAGVGITNPPDKLALSGVELSYPIERFTKAGTYTISMYAKDIPKEVADTTNLLSNGDAETTDASGKLSDWGTWSALSSTTFTRRTTGDWKIAGNGSFEIITPSVNDGSNNSGCYYKDITVAPNTKYTLSGLIGAHRCYGYFVTYEMNDKYDIIRVLNSDVISNNPTPQKSESTFTTGNTTTKLRVHIVKGGTTNYTTGGLDYVFADNITVVKMLPNSKFNEYRKTSLSDVLDNGNAEKTNPNGSIYGWLAWAANPSTTTFTRRSGDMWTITGSGTFEIHAPQSADNVGVYYKDVDASPNNDYTFNATIGAHRCYGYFYIDEIASNGTVLNSIGIDGNSDYALKKVSKTFRTNANTVKLRIHIVKGSPTYVSATDYAYVFVDDVSLMTSKATATIYAHRVPRAEFSYQIENAAGSFKIKNLVDNGLSYDPDHTDKANKGIINSQWRWAEIKSDGTTLWHDGKVPDTLSFPTGTQVLMWYRVQDSDGPNGIGAWSLPKAVGTDGSLADPVALFVASPNPVPKQTLLDMFDQSYSANFGGYITGRTWTLQKVGGAVQPLYMDYADYANNKYSKWFGGATYGFGKYIVTLTVSDSYGKVSKPYSQTIEVIDNINPTVSVNPTTGTYSGLGGASVNVTCSDNTSSTNYNRGLKTIDYVWSKNASNPVATDTVQTINIPSEGTHVKNFTAAQAKEGTWYLYVKDTDYAGNTSNGDSYVKFGPYTIETLKAANFYVTMMLDIGWRSYYFDITNGIDDNHDGEKDRYPRRANTDIGTLKMPINYYNLVGHAKTYIKAGYKVKGKIDILGTPDWAEFHIKYIKEGGNYTDIVALTKATGDTYTFEWIIPLETDTNTFVSFDLVTKKGYTTYGNEKWVDTWDVRNTSRTVFYVKGKATDDLIYVQSQ